MEGMAGKEGSTSKMKLVKGGKERTGYSYNWRHRNTLVFAGLVDAVYTRRMDKF
jgi:hypothetical protein